MCSMNIDQQTAAKAEGCEDELKRRDLGVSLNFLIQWAGEAKLYEVVDEACKVLQVEQLSVSESCLIERLEIARKLQELDGTSVNFGITLDGAKKLLQRSIQILRSIDNAFGYVIMKRVEAIEKYQTHLVEELNSEDSCPLSVSLLTESGSRSSKDSPQKTYGKADDDTSLSQRSARLSKKNPALPPTFHGRVMLLKNIQKIRKQFWNDLACFIDVFVIPWLVRADPDFSPSNFLRRHSSRLAEDSGAENCCYSEIIKKHIEETLKEDSSPSTSALSSFAFSEEMANNLLVMTEEVLDKYISNHCPEPPLVVHLKDSATHAILGIKTAL